MSRPTIGAPLAIVSIVLTVVTWLFAAAAEARQNPQDLDPPPRDSDRLAWYTVQPGDTLSKITARTLGTARLWRENWRLNPEVRDPDLLRPGSRLRIIEHRELPERSAEIAEVVRVVERRSAEEASWQAAAVGNLLREQDALQTRRRSSAELVFDDGTELRVSESTLLFLRAVGQRLSGVTEQTIEIERGGAELTLAPRRADASEVEVVVGDARARPATGSSGRSHSRLRSEEAGASISVFDGSSEVEASGGRVDVPRGAGTRVETGQPPSPPEPLLPPPRPLAPTPGQSIAWANPEFRWEGPAGAATGEIAGWEIEICFDPDCARLADRGDGLTALRWQPEEPLPAGPLHWRVRARSASGLDGFPTRAVPFEITDPRPDLAPPTVAVAIDGPGREHPGDAIFLGAEGAVTPQASDDVSGVAALRHRWDDGDWTPTTAGAALAPPADDREHRLELSATDAAGRASETVRYTVTRFASAPAPPTLEVQPPDRR